MCSQSVMSSEMSSGLSQTPGAMLRKIREGLKLSDAEVAAQLCLSKNIINSIEADEFDKLHGLTFVRGYLRAYAKLLGISQDEVINAFNVLYPDTRQRAPMPQRDYQNKTIKQKRRSDFSVKLVGYGLLVGMLILMLLWWHNHSSIKQTTMATATSHAKTTVTANALPNAAATTPAIGPAVDEQTQMTVVDPLASNVQQTITHAPPFSVDNSATTKAIINQTIANAAALPGINTTPPENTDSNMTTTTTTTPTSITKPNTGWKNPDF